MPGANSRHEGATDSACKSPILLRDEIARDNNAFKVKNLVGTYSKGLKEPGKYLAGQCQIPCRHPGASCRPQPQSSMVETRYQGVSPQWHSTQRNVVGTYGHHINLQSGRGWPCSEPILQELQHCTDWAVNWVQLTVTTPWSENFPLQGIKFPRGGSSWVENGLKNLGWETWVYELGPLRGQAHSFHSSGWGWNIEPPAWDRRSLLTGSSRGGPSRRDIKSGNHTLPGNAGQWEVVEPSPANSL